MSKNPPYITDPSYSLMYYYDKSQYAILYDDTKELQKKLIPESQAVAKILKKEFSKIYYHWTSNKNFKELNFN